MKFSNQDSCCSYNQTLTNIQFIEIKIVTIFPTKLHLHLCRETRASISFLFQKSFLKTSRNYKYNPLYCKGNIQNVTTSMAQKPAQLVGTPNFQRRCHCKLQVWLCSYLFSVALQIAVQMYISVPTYIQLVSQVTSYVAYVTIFHTIFSSLLQFSCFFSDSCCH